jgi:hypothetical protein
MNETLSLLLATSILAAGGLGLYMYKSTHDDEDENSTEVSNEQAIELSELDILSMNEIKNSENKLSDEEENYKEPEQKIRKRGGGGYITKRNRKMTSSKRKY